MSNPGAHEEADDRIPTSEFSEEWFDRELAELKACLARLEGSLEPPAPVALEPQSQPDEPVKPEIQEPAPAPAPASVSPLAAPSALPVSPRPPEAPAVPVPQPAAPPTPDIPTGTDLADPKNFGMLPPTTALDRGTASADEYRQRLARHLAFATKVLHTSRVPAAVWREWRAFEKAVQLKLRELTSRPVEIEQY